MNTIQTSKRNLTVDSVKGIASLAVILLHFPFPGLFGEVCCVLARFAVPFFFMCSGYYFYKPEGCQFKSFKRKVYKIFRLCVFSILFYALFNVAYYGSNYVLSEISLINLLKALIFNAPQFTSIHIWFLLALLYSYFFVYILQKTKVYKHKLFVVIPLLFINLLIMEILPVIGLTLPKQLVRNAWAFGIPFFLLGTYIKEKEESLMSVNKTSLVFAIGIGTLLALIEKFLLLGENNNSDLFLGTIISTIAIFIFCCKYKCISIPFLNFIGEKCSLYIYLFHIAIGICLYKYLDFLPHYLYVLPILVGVISIIVSLFFLFLTQQTRDKREWKL